MKSLEKVMDYLNNYYPEIFTIADAKRADIGNTSKRYAKAYFDNFDFDCITVAPYMGADSVEPFLTYKNKIYYFIGVDISIKVLLIFNFYLLERICFMKKL